MVMMLMVVVGKGWPLSHNRRLVLRVLSQCARIRRAPCRSSSSSLPRLSVVAGDTYTHKRVAGGVKSWARAIASVYVCAYACGVAGPCSTARTIERARGEKTQREGG